VLDNPLDNNWTKIHLAFSIIPHTLYKVGARKRGARDVRLLGSRDRNLRLVSVLHRLGQQETTMRSIVITSCAVALLIFAGAAKASDIITAGTSSAQRCMHNVLVTNLRVGVHGRERLTKLAVSVCGPDLMELVLNFYPGADQRKLKYSMVTEAERQLDTIIASGEWDRE
jgi:hypothetical protein